MTAKHAEQFIKDVKARHSLNLHISCFEKKQQQLQAAVEAVKESPKLYNSTAGIYGGDTQEKHNRPINIGEVDSSNAGLFHLEEWQPRFRKVLLRMPPRTQSERVLKESFGMHEV